MKRGSKVRIAVLVALLVVLVGGVRSCQMLADGMCGNRVVSEATSPDGKHRAVVFMRDCGATTGFSTQVSIVDVDETLQNEGGNVFVADRKGGDGPDVMASWSDKRLLRVTYHSDMRVFQAEHSASGVAIEYVVLSK